MSKDNVLIFFYAIPEAFGVPQDYVGTGRVCGASDNAAENERSAFERGWPGGHLQN